MKNRVSKTKGMSVEKRFKQTECQIEGTNLEQVDFQKWKMTELASKCSKANAVRARILAKLFCKKEVSSKTKLAVHWLIFQPTLLHGRENCADTGYLINKFQVIDRKVAWLIACTNRRNIMTKKYKLRMDIIDEAVWANRL